MNGKKVTAFVAGLTAASLFVAAGCAAKPEPPDSTAEQVIVTVKVKPEQTSQPETSSKPDESEVPKENTFVDEAGEVVEYEDVLTGICTAYTGDPKTAAGAAPEVGVVAVDPGQIPYGTRLYITSEDGSIVYGYAIAADTGDAMVDGDVLCDLYLDSEEECEAFGRQLMQVYLLPDDSE